MPRVQGWYYGKYTDISRGRTSASRDIQLLQRQNTIQKCSVTGESPETKVLSKTGNKRRITAILRAEIKVMNKRQQNRETISSKTQQNFHNSVIVHLKE